MLIQPRGGFSVQNNAPICRIPIIAVACNKRLFYHSPPLLIYKLTSSFGWPIITSTSLKLFWDGPGVIVQLVQPNALRSTYYNYLPEYLPRPSSLAGPLLQITRTESKLWRFGLDDPRRLVYFFKINSMSPFLWSWLRRPSSCYQPLRCPKFIERLDEYVLCGLVCHHRLPESVRSDH